MERKKDLLLNNYEVGKLKRLVKGQIASLWVDYEESITPAGKATVKYYLKVYKQILKKLNKTDYAVIREVKLGGYKKFKETIERGKNK